MNSTFNAWKEDPSSEEQIDPSFAREQDPDFDDVSGVGLVVNKKPQLHEEHIRAAQAAAELQAHQQAEAQQHVHHHQQRHSQQLAAAAAVAAAHNLSEEDAKKLAESEAAGAVSPPGSLRNAARNVSSTKRAAQNRSAQKAFRQRKEKYIKDLEQQAAEAAQLKQTVEELRAENLQLRDYTLALQSRVIELSPTTHGAAPGSAQQINEQLGLPTPPAVFGNNKFKNDI